MSITVTPTMDAVCAAFGNFIATIVPAGTPIQRGPINRTAPPAVDYVLFTPIYGRRLRTNLVLDDATTGLATWEQGRELRVQVDFYGGASADWCDTFSTLFRSDVAVDFLMPTLAPLHADDGRMMPLVTGEEQYLERWMVEAHCQVNFVVSTPQDYVDTLVLDLIDVEVAFPS